MTTKTISVGDKVIVKDHSSSRHEKTGEVWQYGPHFCCIKFDEDDVKYWIRTEFVFPAEEGVIVEDNSPIKITAHLDDIVDPGIAKYVRHYKKGAVFAEDEKEMFEYVPSFEGEPTPDDWYHLSSEGAAADIIMLSQEDITVRNLITKLINLHRELDDARRNNIGLSNMLDASRTNHAEDIALIGERLIEESDERNWCEEFDEIIDDINVRLHADLPIRRKEFEVRVNYSVYASSSVTVTARNEDDAVASVRDNFDSYIDVMEGIQDSISYGGGLNIDDFEADEA